ncbi:lariat debranching enzyme [Balamuthia mandrillaris]
MQRTETGIKVAVVGCSHGELDQIYSSILHIQECYGITIDLLLCCGDFQAVRNLEDLNSLSCKPTYRRMNTFYKYYSGEMTAPVLTLFIGGNHEASNHLAELYYGGWVAPNIYYMGAAGVLNFAGLRIAGISGIFKGYDYRKGHFEQRPFSEGELRSVYHVREYEVWKMLQIAQPIDIFMSHDWPRGIARYGNTHQLLQWKTFLRPEVENNTLGSPGSEQLLHTLKPRYWLSGHMHVKFAAIVNHPSSGDADRATTKYLALDKVGPRKDFLQILHFPEATEPKKLLYDVEWMAILRSTNHLYSFSPSTVQLPSRDWSPKRYNFTPTPEELQWVEERLSSCNAGRDVPNNFERTAPIYAPMNDREQRLPLQTESQPNPQHTSFLKLLDLPDIFHAPDSLLPQGLLLCVIHSIFVSFFFSLVLFTPAYYYRRST